MIRISEYLDRLDDVELKSLIGLIILYKRERDKYIKALGKEDSSIITMNDDGQMILRTTTVSAFVQTGDFELNFLRQLIKEYKTSERAFEKFKELIDIVWKGWLPPYTLCVSSSHFYLEWEETIKKSILIHSIDSRIDLGFDKFLSVLRGDFRK